MANIQLKTLKFPGLEDTYIIPEVYINDTNKDGNVKLIFGSKPLITFTITDFYGIGDPFEGYGDSLTFNFDEGMTWNDWINSSYNVPTAQIKISGGYIQIGNGYIYSPEGIDVKPTDKIIANGQYKAGN